MDEVTTIDLSDETDRWRYVCPTCGSREWEATNYHFWCANCAGASSQNTRAEPEFDELHDLREGRTLPRDQVRLVGDGYQMHHSGGLPPTADS